MTFQIVYAIMKLWDEKPTAFNKLIRRTSQ
nr:MAG TPA: hypothetical protein [Caudoviricetes sp.]